MQKKVLFVDDEPQWRSTVEIWLKDAAYDALIAADATEALEKADGQRLGTIILDLNLGGEKGIDLVKFLRRNHPDVPIILFTGMQHDDFEIKKMLEQGAHQYLQKGTREEFLKALKRSFR
jgi:DNA-binding response OmpR family regulator